MINNDSKYSSCNKRFNKQKMRMFCYKNKSNSSKSNNSRNCIHKKIVNYIRTKYKVSKLPWKTQKNKLVTKKNKT